jgi:hypothetical protein
LRATIVSVACSRSILSKNESADGLWHMNIESGRQCFPLPMIFWLNSSASSGRPSARRWLVFNRGTIKYGYRHVELSNARAMEGLLCECFPTVRDAIDDFSRDITSYVHSTAGRW